MITTRHMHLDMELVKWLLLAVLATALALAFATAVAALPRSSEVARDPGEVGCRVISVRGI